MTAVHNALLTRTKCLNTFFFFSHVVECIVCGWHVTLRNALALVQMNVSLLTPPGPMQEKIYSRTYSKGI